MTACERQNKLKIQTVGRDRQEVKSIKQFKDKFIIGIDHGYGNIKTANHVFKTGVLKSDGEPLFTKNLLVYDGRYYTIGAGHKEFTADKQTDGDYYVLTLAAIATELKDRDITDAEVIIAAGLPLTWTNGQKAEFSAYLTQNNTCRKYRKEERCNPVQTGLHRFFLKNILITVGQNPFRFLLLRHSAFEIVPRTSPRQRMSSFPEKTISL